ncbi:peptidyl-prolyl cis-trans isomerase [Bacteroidia bacterium]|nr:peptidyl-prolyl cis-trans isomerase [Bacteroidia bacterium]
MVTKNKVVSLSYELRTEPNGEILEVATSTEPLEFIFGQGQTLEYFELNLLEKKKGEPFDFKLAAANAYGERNEELVIDLPRETFKETDAEDLRVGNVFPMQDSIGRRMQGTIVEFNDVEVRIDLNHPLAGKDLYFKGQVVGVRDATEQELEALASHKCGCGCGMDGCDCEAGECCPPNAHGHGCCEEGECCPPTAHGHGCCC